MPHDPSDYRDFERYCAMLRRWASPDEIEQFLRKVGSIEDANERWDEVEAFLEERRARAAVWRFLRVAAVYFAAVVGFLATLKALVPDGVLPW